MLQFYSTVVAMFSVGSFPQTHNDSVHLDAVYFLKISSSLIVLSFSCFIAWLSYSIFGSQVGNLFVSVCDLRSIFSRPGDNNALQFLRADVLCWNIATFSFLLVDVLLRFRFDIGLSSSSNSIWAISDVLCTWIHVRTALYIPIVWYVYYATAGDGEESYPTWCIGVVPGSRSCLTDVPSTAGNRYFKNVLDMYRMDFGTRSLWHDRTTKFDPW